MALRLAAGSSGSLGTVSGTQAVLQSVAMLLATPQGSRAMVPEFGCPPLPGYPAAVPAWNQELAASLTLLHGVKSAEVLATLDHDGQVRGVVRIRTDGGEELTYDLNQTNAG